MSLALITGLIAGVAFGYVLMRTNLCFHSTFRGLYERRYGLARTWALGVAIAAVGLSLVYELGPWDGLNRGLPLRPVANAGGGLVFGIGMVVAASCVSGLFYKLGSGMLGALVGLAGWAAGELVGGRLDVPGPTLLPLGERATLAGVLGLPRLMVAVPLAAAVAAWLLTGARRSSGSPAEASNWSWRTGGVALGIATIGAWMLAGAGGASFGPSTVGAVSAAVSGRPNFWLSAFLLGLIPGATIAARTTGSWHLRTESWPRYLQLAVGGALLGAGARVAGGCNLGHGVSGLAQLNVSSFVAVAGMVAGVGLARTVAARVGGLVADWRPRAVHEGG